MNKLKNKFKTFLKSGAVLMASVIALSGASTALAETSNTLQSPNISTSQGLTSSPSAHNNSSQNNVASSVQGEASGSDTSAKNIMRGIRSGSENATNNNINSVKNIANEVQSNAANASDSGSYANLPALDGLKERTNNVIDEGGTTTISWGIRIFTYVAFISAIVCGILAIISLFVKKMPTLRFIGASIGSLAILFCLMKFFGGTLSLGSDNIFAQVMNYIFNG